MIYLDNNSTTFLDPEVLAAMNAHYDERVGNPSSIHQYGQRAKGVLNVSIQRCSQFFAVHPDEMIFTSGATEALNFFINNLPPYGHVITSSIEHLSIIEPLKRCGREVSYLDPKPGLGAVSPCQIKEAIRPNTCMIILSGANNETGVRIDLESIAQIAEAANIAFVLDGVAILGKASFRLPRGVKAACFSAHKIHGPLGIGLVIVKKGYKMRPFILGGQQQWGLRAGSENLPAIVGFTKALELLDDKWIARMSQLRDRFEEAILSSLSDVIIHGKAESRICNTSNMAFLGVEGETLLMALDIANLAASHGSACSSATLKSSHVLLNMGIEPNVVRSSLRFSLSRLTTEEEIDRSIALITSAVQRLRQLVSC